MGYCSALGTYAERSRGPFATYLVCLAFSVCFESVTTPSSRLFSVRRFLSSFGTKQYTTSILICSLLPVLYQCCGS